MEYLTQAKAQHQVIHSTAQVLLKGNTEENNPDSMLMRMVKFQQGLMLCVSVIGGVLAVKVSRLSFKGNTRLEAVVMSLIPPVNIYCREDWDQEPLTRYLTLKHTNLHSIQ